MSSAHTGSARSTIVCVVVGRPAGCRTAYPPPPATRVARKARRHRGRVRVAPAARPAAPRPAARPSTGRRPRRPPGRDGPRGRRPAGSRPPRPSPASSRGSAPRARSTSASSTSIDARLHRHRPQHVEGVDVAGALPHRVQPGSPGRAGRGRAPRRSRCRRGTPSPRRPAGGALGDPVLGDRDGDPQQVGLAGVDGGGQPHREQRSRPRSPARGRRARSASAACRPAATRTPGGAGRGAGRGRRRAA